MSNCRSHAHPRTHARSVGERRQFRRPRSRQRRATRVRVDSSGATVAVPTFGQFARWTPKRVFGDGTGATSNSAVVCVRLVADFPMNPLLVHACALELVSGKSSGPASYGKGRVGPGTLPAGGPSSPFIGSQGLWFPTKPIRADEVDAARAVDIEGERFGAGVTAVLRSAGRRASVALAQRREDVDAAHREARSRPMLRRRRPN